MSGHFGRLEWGPDDPRFWNAELTWNKIFKVRTKDGGKPVPFNLLPSQVILNHYLLRAYTERKFIVHVKPRKEGSSTFFTGALTQNVCFRPGVTGAIISQRDDITNELAEAAIRFHDNLPTHLKPKRRLGVKRTLEILRPGGNDSKLSLGTAGQDDPGRGWMGLQALVCTEICKWKDPSVWTSILGNLPDSRRALVVAESTPLHHKDELWQLWEKSKEPDSPWLRCFLPWTMVPEYAASPPAGWNPTPEIAEYAHKYRITDEQTYWMATLGIHKAGSLDKFRAEFPINELDCWRLAGESVFDRDVLEARLQDIIDSGAVDDDEEYQEWISPRVRPNSRFVIGVDPAGSWSKRDHFGIEVIDLDHCEQAAEWLRHGDAFTVAKDLVDLAVKYNNAIIYVEANGIGEALIMALIHLGYENLYYRSEDSPGWWSSKGRKAEAIAIGQELIGDGSFIIYSRRLLEQLASYRGTWDRVSRDARGGHHDLVAAACLGLWAYQEEGGYATKAPELSQRDLARRAINRVKRAIAQRSSDISGNNETRWGRHR